MDNMDANKINRGGGKKMSKLQFLILMKKDNKGHTIKIYNFHSF